MKSSGVLIPDPVDALKRWILVVTLCLAACGRADRGLVATVDDWSLTEDRMAELLVLAQPFPLDSGGVVDLARYWMAAAAFSMRWSEGDPLASDTVAAEATWLDRREGLLAADRESRLGREIQLGPDAVREAFEEGAVRLVAHVVRRVGPETSSSERLLQQRTAERILAALVDGGSWDRAVEESEDVTSRSSAGLLGLFGAGELPPTLDRALFRLEPGQISSVVQTREGFHILYRPRYEDVRGLFASRLRERLLTEADEAANRRDREARGLTLAGGAIELLGRIARDPLDWFDSDRPLASWQDGSLGAGVVARYAASLTRPARSELAAADEEARRAFLDDVAIRELRIQDLASVDEETGAVDTVYARLHADEMGYWQTALGLDGSGSAEAIEAALDRHMETLVSRRIEARAMAPLLEAWLLRRVDHALYERGVLRAVHLARGMVEGARGEEEGPP